MLRLIASFLIIGIGIIGLLSPNSSRAQEPQLGPCFDFDLRDSAQVLPRVAMVVVGRVSDVEPGQHARVEPEAYLKGPTSAETLVLPYRQSATDCRAAELSAGERVVLVLGREDGKVAWPGESQVFVVEGSTAVQGGSDGETLSEAELIQRIRSHTGQYSVPAGSEDERARIDWGGTVLPVGAAAIVVFAIGLILMREWHRIDPS